MKVYSYDAKTSKGEVYSMRLLLNPEELAGLQEANLIPTTGVSEVVGWVHAEPEIVDAAKLVDNIRVKSLSKE